MESKPLIIGNLTTKANEACRLPSDAEMEFALEFLKQQGNLDDARVWSELCHVLVNVKEFIFLR